MPDIRTTRRRAGRTLRVALAAAVAGSALGLTPIGLTGTATAADNTSATTAPAGSEERARADAKRTGDPVEILSRRTEISETHALPNGNLRQTQHTSPVRVQRDGAWKPVDTTLATAAGRVAPKAAAGHVTFSAGGDAPLVVLRDQGRELSLSWPKALPKPVLDGSTATYREVLPGVDLAVAASVDGFSQALVVKNAEAAKNPELNTVDFGLKTDGLTLKKDAESGTFSAVNPAGQPVFSSSTARMWDSSGTDESVAAPAVASRNLPLVKRSARSATAKTTTPPSDLTPGTNSAKVDVRVSGDTLSLTPDQALLDAADTTYPVYIDPKVTGTRQAWTIAYKPHANSSYWNGTGWGGGTTSEARVGYESSTGGTARSFFQVDSKFLAGAQVVDAQFQITQTHSWSCTAKPVELYLTGAISKATTWNKQPSWSTRQDVRNYAHGNESFGCPDKAIDLKANDAAQKAAAGKWSNITFGLRAPQSAEDAKDAYSWKKFKPDAKLIVEFNRAPKAPWALDTIPSTKVGTECGNGSTYVSIGKTDVTLTAQTWDPDGNDVEVKFHLWATGKHDVAPGVFINKTVKVSTKASDPKGSSARLSVKLTELAPHLGASGGQFSWKAQSKDIVDKGSLASDWTPTKGAPGCRFRIDADGPTVMPTVTSINGHYPPDAEGALPRTEEEFLFTTPGVSDVGHYKWGLDRPAHITAAVTDPSAKDGPAKDKVTPLTPGPHTLYVQVFDKAGNPGLVTPYKFLVKSPGHVDKPGDVNGDGVPDMFAIDGKNDLRLYGGTGNGGFATTIPMSTTGAWAGSVMTHRGSLDEDFDEDLLVRTADGRLVYYPNNGQGVFSDAEQQDVHLFENSSTGLAVNPADIKQIVSLGDVTPVLPGHDGEGHHPDYVAVIGDQLWYLPGQPSGMIETGYPIGDAGWGRMTLLSPGDVNGDGKADIVARDTVSGAVWLYQGKAHPDLDGNGTPDADGTDPASLGDTANRTTYATGWTSAARPLVTASGDADGDNVPDLWTTTAVSDKGLEFFPGSKTGPVGPPTVVGTGGWQAIKGIF